MYPLLLALQRGHLADAEAHRREAQAAIEACELPLVEWRIAATAARVHDKQRRRTDAEVARRRSAAILNQLAASLPPEHELRQSLLSHPSVSEVPRARKAVSRSRRRS